MSDYHETFTPAIGQEMKHEYKTSKVVTTDRPHPVHFSPPTLHNEMMRNMKNAKRVSDKSKFRCSQIYYTLK